MQFWVFFLFFARRKNRPNPCVCLELKIWRPFVEFWWRIAEKKYIQRNPNETAPTPRWQTIKQEANNEESGSSLKEKKDDEEKKRHSRLLRKISQHADI